MRIAIRERDVASQIEPASKSGIEKAAMLLRRGDLVAFPTETVYGLGGDATSPIAVARIFEAKGRPSFNPLITHVPDLDAVRSVAELSPLAISLAGAFWPGPLTLVLRKKARCPISDLATAGLDTIAIRIPRHPVAQALLTVARCPVAAPSANRSGHVSATLAAHVATDLGAHVALILDGGPTEVGIESTVIDATGDRPFLLRAGAITVERIAAVVGGAVKKAGEDGDRPSSPGRLLKHYAPRARLRLNATSVAPGEALLAFGPGAPASDGSRINLSERGNLTEAAANLFSALRELDALGAQVIAVTPIPETGLGEAINDRLRRAAED
jgi:L-threonylcarbamoyladenylate synthase